MTHTPVRFPDRMARAVLGWLKVLAAALPVQFALLRFGGPGSVLDQIGVVMTILQWFLMGRISRP